MTGSKSSAWQWSRTVTRAPLQPVTALKALLEPYLLNRARQCSSIACQCLSLLSTSPAGPMAAVVRSYAESCLKMPKILRFIIAVSVLACKGIEKCFLIFFQKNTWHSYHQWQIIKYKAIQCTSISYMVSVNNQHVVIWTFRSSHQHSLQYL